MKTITDFTDQDKIALPAVKVSVQAMMLQMAAAKQWGQANYAKLDPITVGMSPPDATVALLERRRRHHQHVQRAAVPVSAARERRHPHVLNSYEVFGGPHTFTVAWTSSQFRTRTPRSTRRWSPPSQEATQMLNKDVKPAAQSWIDNQKSKLTVEKVPRSRPASK